MKRIVASIACLTAALCAGVHAATVNNSVTATYSSTRWMTTGCKYADALTSGGSIGIWVKSISSFNSTGVPIFGSCLRSGNSEQGILLSLNTTGAFVFKVAGSKDGAVNSVIAAASQDLSDSIRNDGKWHFLLGTFDIASGKLRFYIDGDLVSEKAISLDTLVSARCFTVNAVGKTSELTASATSSDADNKDNNGDIGFLGFYAEATLWNKALSAEEVAALCTRRAYPWDDGLIGYWPLAKTTANLAENATTRNDGSRPNALCYYRQTATDADFFDDPPTRFVASAEWVSEKGYTQVAGATFQNPDEPATNATEAVAAAASSETVYLMPGTHLISAQIDFTKANLTVTGRYGAFNSAEAIIDAQEICRHFRSYSQASGQSGFVVENLTLVNGMAGDGGSMYFRSCTGIVRNCIFRSNATSTGNGGAIHSYTANGTVISNCVFASNSAGAYGGAIYTEQNSNSSSDRCFVIDCVITNNTASRSGGGVYASKCIEIKGCRFADNVANTTDGYKRGGAIYAGNYSKVSASTFSGGSTAVYGSAIELAGNSIAVTNCNFAGLSASSSYGVIHVNATSNCRVFDCIFTNTTWGSGSQLFFVEGTAASLTVRQCLIVPDSGSGAVVNNYNGGQTRFENCTMLSSAFDSQTRGPSQNTLVNCIVPNADITSSGSFVNILTNCLVKSVSGGTQDSGVIVGNPRFVDAANGDYSLNHNSPCRDRGLLLDWMTTDATDIIGNPRVVTDGRPLVENPSALPDIGCYECMLPHVGLMLLVF